MGDGRAGATQIFAKFDLLPIDNDSKKKNEAKNIKVTPNSSIATGNITLVYFR